MVRSFGSPGEPTLSSSRMATPRQGPGKDLLSARGLQLLKFILMPVVMTNIRTHFQRSQGESCWWNGSRFRDVFPPVLFNVRFSNFPHLWNKKAKQQGQRQNKRSVKTSTHQFRKLCRRVIGMEVRITDLRRYAVCNQRSQRGSQSKV